MKVVQILNALKGGGAERIVQTLATSFSLLGHKSIIILLEGENKNPPQELKEVELVFVSPKNLVQTLERLQADLILAHMKTPQKILRKIYWENLFFVIHNTQSKRLKKRRFLTKLLYGSRVKKLQKLFNGHKLVTVSIGVADDLKGELKILPGSMDTIYNPFDIHYIQEKANEPIEVEKAYIIHVARLETNKRQDVLLKAYAKSGVDEDLVILGDGSQMTPLKKLAETLHIASKVHFLGWKQNPYPYMKNAELFVLSSELEGFGNVLVESLIVHTPVVSTDCQSGPSEILTGTLQNNLVEVNNVEALAKKIKEAIENKVEVTPEVYQRFEANEVAKEYLSLLE